MTQTVMGRHGDRQELRYSYHTHAPGAVRRLVRGAPFRGGGSALADDGAGGDGGALAAGGLAAQGEETESCGGEVTDGISFASALGGQATYNEEDGKWVVSLTGDVELTDTVLVKSGEYVLKGRGVITRTGNYTGELLKLSASATLEVSGSVALDGGAVWVGADEPGSAVGATGNSGVSGAGPLVHSLGGRVALSGDAELRSNDGGSAVLSEGGEVSIAGGSVHGISVDRFGAVRVNGDSGSVSVSGGSLWGNRSYDESAVWVRGGSLDVSGGEISRNFSGDAGRAAAAAQQITVTGGTFSGNSGPAIGPMSAAATIEVKGGDFEDNGGCAIAGVGRSVSVSGGTFSGNAGAVPAGSALSGSPVFATDSDTVSAPVTLAGALGDGTVVRLVSTSYAAGSVVVAGTNTYSITDSDAAQFSLASAAPQGTYLSFNPENNQIVITVKTPILIEATVNEPVYYDANRIEAGQDKDFAVRVYEYADEEKGEEITGNYTVGGGALNVEFKYREADSTGDYMAGLPTDAGAYTILVAAAADNANSRASGSMTFLVTISPMPIAFSIGSLSDVYYTGDAFSPEPEVSSPDVVELVKGLDYEYRYEGNLEPGTCTVTVMGIDNYSGSASTQFEILPIPVLVEVQASQGDVVYDGQPVVPGEDFTVRVYEYKDNVRGAEITDDYAVGDSPAISFAYRVSGSQAGFAEGLPSDVGSYTVRATVSDDAANRRSGASADFELSIVKAYTVTWMNGGDTLEVDGNVPEGSAPSYGGDKPARETDAQYAYLFAGWANKYGQESGADVADLPPVTADATYYAAFSKTVNSYTVTFTDGNGVKLKEQSVEYGSSATPPDDPIREGFAFKGWDADFSNITGDLTVNAIWEKQSSADPCAGGHAMQDLAVKASPDKDGYRYQKCSVCGTVVRGEDIPRPTDFVLSASAFTYDGKANTPSVTVRDAGGKTIPASDYAITYSNNTDAGTATATVTFKSDSYEGAKSLSFKIAPKAVTPTVALSQASYTYDGRAKTPAVTVKDGSKALAKGADYDVSYPAGRVNAGSYAVKVTLKGNYSGSKSASFNIGKAAQAISASNVSKTYGAPAFALGAKRTAGDGALAYASSNAKVAAVGADGKVAIKGAGKATITVTARATANYNAASKSVTVTVAKAANPMAAKGKTATVKYSKAKKKAQTLAASKVVAFTKKGQGKVTYKVTKYGKNAKKYVKVASNGKVTVKKGAKKGTYTLKVKVTAAGNANYKAKSKTVTVKVKVK